MNRLFAAVSISLVIAGCATQPETPPPPVPAGTLCDSGTATIDDSFIGARRGACTMLGPTAFELSIVREDDAVRNPSPWYAFRVTSDEAVSITLDYGDWKHRYVPKLSRDGSSFELVPDAWVSQADENSLSLNIPAGSNQLLISAQQLLTPEDYEVWRRRLAERTEASLTIAGRSVADLPVYKVESGAEQSELIFMTGRQHPPEVSGAVAMMAFLNTVYGDSDLARQFRERFHLVSLPLMNPDGVIAGHWRHNLGQTDLNRDWGPFTQPETRIVKDLLDEFDDDGKSVEAFVDFHSTGENLVYLQAEPTDPEGFSAIWLARAQKRLRTTEGLDYAFDTEPRPSSETANGKNYMYKRYGIPSVTYEVGDETTDHDATVAAAIFAEEFMRLALERL